MGDLGLAVVTEMCLGRITRLALVGDVILMHAYVHAGNVLAFLQMSINISSSLPPTTSYDLYIRPLYLPVLDKYTD